MSNLPDWVLEIKARAEAATPGPWYGDTDSCDVYLEYDQDPETFEPRGIASLKHGPQQSLDTSFIAHSRTDVPKLLKALEIAMEGLEHIKSIKDPVASETLQQIKDLK